MLRNKVVGLKVTEGEKRALQRLAEIEGGLSEAATVRRLILKSAHRLGLWRPGENTPAEENRAKRIR